MEHHSNIVPWQLLAAPGTGAVLKLRGCEPLTGRLVMEDYDRLLSDRTRIVSVTHVSRIRSAWSIPVAEITRLAHDAGALCLS